jgi:MFS family permease
MFGISMALGPVLGGFLVSAISWRAVFFVNLPFTLGAIALTAFFVPESRAPRPRRVDPVGQVLVVVALGTLTYAIIEAGRVGFEAPVLALLAFALACFVGLVAYELRRRDPLLEVRFFGSAPFAGASATAICQFAATGGVLFLSTIYLQSVRGLSPLHAGLYLLPMAVMMIVFPPVSGRLTARFGTRPSLLLGGLAVAASGVMLTGLAPDTPITLLLGAYLLFGIGSGLVNTPITHTAVSGMPPAQAGVAAGVASASRSVGMTLGVAVFGAVAGAGLAAGFGPEFAQATQPAWWIVAGLGLTITALGFLTTTGWAHGTARRTAERLAEPAVPVEGDSRYSSAQA